MIMLFRRGIRLVLVVWGGFTMFHQLFCGGLKQHAEKWDEPQFWVFIVGWKIWKQDHRRYSWTVMHEPHEFSTAKSAAEISAEACGRGCGLGLCQIYVECCFILFHKCFIYQYWIEVFWVCVLLPLALALHKHSFCLRKTTHRSRDWRPYNPKKASPSYFDLADYVPMAQALRRAGRIPSRCTESGLDQSELNQITATWHHSHGHFVMLEIDQIWPKGSNDLCLAETGGLEWARAEGLTAFLHSAKLINTRSRQQICAGDISEDSENNAFASESVPSESVPTKIQFARGIIIIGWLCEAASSFLDLGIRLHHTGMRWPWCTAAQHRTVMFVHWQAPEERQAVPLICFDASKISKAQA